jgi:dTMP kinase
VAELIRPSLDAGKVVITDRYYFSTVAYQGARGFDPAELLRRNEAIAVEPQLLVLIDLDPETSLARIGNRDGQANEFETRAQLTRTREIFLNLRKPYLVRFDGNLSPAQLTAAILAAADGALANRLPAQAHPARTSGLSGS